MGMRGRQGRGSRTGTFLVLAGIVGVLSVTFIAGVWTGRNWPVIVGNPKSPVAAEPPVKGRLASERSRPAEPLPPLTFYHDLKLPLTAPPPAPKPAKPPRLPELKREEPEAASPARPAATPAPAPAPAQPPAAEAGTRFTVQVAAYNVKPLAEALRTTLAAAGHEARVVEADGGVRYRVQVGAYPTKEAAREAAARLAAERSLPTFVTTR
jgi:septal ring-binding cell division protein DamX